MKSEHSKESLLCKLFGHRMFFDTGNVAGPSTCKRCDYKERGVVWPRVSSKPLNTASEDSYMKQNKTASDGGANAMAQDYENICPDTGNVGNKTGRHIFGGLIIAAIVVALATIGIVMYN